MTSTAVRVYVLVGCLAASAYFVLPRGGLLYDGWYLLFGSSAVVALLLGSRKNRPASAAPWRLLAGAYALWVAGDATYIVYSVLDKDLPYPSIADGFYLLGYPLLAAGLLVMIRRRTPGRDWASLIDAAIVTTGAAVVSWVFLMEPYARDSSMTLVQKLVSIAYPLMDVLLLSVVARMLITSGLRSRSYAFLSVALVVQLVGDVFYGIGSLQGWYVDGHPIDLLWIGAYLLWGAAGLHPSMVGLTEPGADPEKRLTRGRLGLLGFATLMAPGMMLLESVRSSQLELLVTVAASVVLFGLVIARLAGVVARHERAVRRELVLRRAAAALVTAHARDEIYRVAVTTALELSEADVAVELELGGPEETTIVASAGRPGVDLRSLPSATAFTLAIQGERQGTIAVRSERALARQAYDGLETLASQVALALESAALTEDLLERQSAERFRSLVQSSSDVIAVMEPDLTIRYHTPSVETVLGYGPAEFVGTNLRAILHPDDLESALGFYHDLRARPGVPAQRDFRLRRRDGRWCSAETVSNNLVEDPNVRGIVLTARDVTERKALEEQLTHQAFHDSLTGLANRALFADRVTHALDRKRRRGGQVAVLFVDLDDFKTVNDSLGHAAGDELLVVTAQRLLSCLRTEDTCARLGGDEFAVLLEEIADLDSATLLAARVLQALSDPVQLVETDVPVRASIGIAMGSAEETASDLLRNADVAMYRAKSDGKNRLEVFERSMHAAALERLELKGELDHALAQNEFELHYQPIVELATGTIAGFEALIRWLHPTRGLISPADFIPLAEETGLIVPLGRWVLQEACAQAGRWAAASALVRPPAVSVNISARQLQDPGFPRQVTQALELSGSRPGDLTLEITESLLMADTTATIARLQELKNIGVRIAIDDFGTGYSSLEYLRRFPVDILKIAKPFVDEVGSSSSQTRLLASILRLGAALDLEIVAEGIETPLQADRLRALRCGFGQGFYFGRPTQSESAAALVSPSKQGAAAA